MVCSAFYRGGLTLLNLLALIGISQAPGSHFLDSNELRQECYKTFTEYRRKADLPPIQWDQGMYNYIQNKIWCPACTFAGKVSSDGLSWGGFTRGNATTLCAQMPLVLIQSFASNYQYPGVGHPFRGTQNIGQDWQWEVQHSPRW